MAVSGAPRSERPSPEADQTGDEAGSAPQTGSALISAGLVMAAGTAVSRVLGFVRVIMIAAVLGTVSRQVDMFTIANTIPNSIYILLAGGALNTVFVPQIVRAIKHDEDHGEAYTNRIITAVLLILAVVTVVVTALAPAIIWLYTDPGWHTPALAPQLNSIVVLAYLCLPQVFFYGAYTLVGQVLNARGVFGPMMWAPIVNNVISVAVFALYLVIWGNGGSLSAPFQLGQALTLGIGSTIGIAAQAAVLIPFMHRAGFRYRPRFDLRGTGLGHTFALARWTLGFVLVSQFGVLVVTRLASGATVGERGVGAGWAVYNNAYLLWILPHSLITVSLVTAMLPSASALAADDDLAGVRREATRTMRLALAAVLPVAAAFVALAGPLAAVLLGWGRGAGATGPVAMTLIAFAIGLVPFTVMYVCQRTYYAMEDTRTPFLQQGLVTVVNVVVALALVLPFRSPELIAPALALAYSFAYVVGVVAAFRSLSFRLPGLSGRAILRHAGRLLLAVAPAAVAAFGVTLGLGRLTADANGVVTKPYILLTLLVAGLVAVPIFWLLARALRIEEVCEIAAPILRRARLSRLIWTRSSTPIPTNPDPTGADDPDLAGPTFILTSDPTSDSVPAEAATMSLDARGEPVAVPPASGTAAPPLDDDRDPLLDTQPAWSDDSVPIGAPMSETDAEGDRPGHPVLASGRVLGQRYRLEEVMAERRSIATWRAFDETLSRSVVCHVLLPDDPRTERVMSAARKSAVATDSRFLRVLDAVQTQPPGDDGVSETGDSEIGSYVVCEYAAGLSLQTLLSRGPLTALEAAWVVREVADAMSGVHSAGLYHQRLNPDTVIITPSGNIKIVGLLLEAALSTQPGVLETTDPATLRRGRLPGQPDTPVSDDVADLGRLLYACLIQRWPGGQQWGLAAAPTDGHASWLSPHQVRAGVSPALDRICDQILHEKPRSEPVRTAHGVVNALTKVLGTADAAGDLERRLRQPVPMIGQLPTSAGSPAVAYWAQQNPPTSPPTPPTNDLGRGGRLAEPGAPVVPDGRRRPPRRRWVIVLVLIVVVAMLVALGVAVVSAFRRNTTAPAPNPSVSTSAPPSSGSPTTAGPYPISSATAFDPTANGGNGEENSGDARLAVDGNPQTRWRTVSYLNNPKLGGLKPGVGLVLDLGSAQSVGRVTLALSGTGTDVQILVPKSTTATTAPTRTVNDWRVVGQVSNAGASATIELSAPVTSRYVLVYLTKLPADGRSFRGGVYEAQVLA